MGTHPVQEGVGQRVLALHRVSVKRPKQDVEPQVTGGELVNGAVFEGETQFVQATSGRVNEGVRVVHVHVDQADGSEGRVKVETGVAVP